MQWVVGRLEVERKAEALATRFGGPPTELESIAGALGIVDIALGDIATAATLQGGPVEGTWGVVLRRADSRTRRRFSLAHEIAHVALGITGDERRYMGEAAARSGRTPAERTCNYFAAALLMPRAMVNSLATDLFGAKELARRFEVSEESMRYRLEQIGLHTLART
jgi:predicted transcriptional regulator